jgi:hypothetical protein
MASPLVSVVMIVCNVERFLAEAIESILGQTFREFEFIVVDYGSVDNSQAIVSSYAAEDGRLKLHKIAHCTLGEARNVGCLLARGRYIAIMDADDVSVPDRLTREVKFMEEHPHVALLGGATEWINVEGKSLGFDEFPTEDHEIKSELAVRCPFCQSAVMIRSHAFRLVGGYRAAFALAEDYDLWLRIAERFHVANLKETVLKYRIHPYQVSLQKRRQQSLCKLAAQVSAAARGVGSPDPANGIEDITPAVLATWGVGEIAQNAILVREYLSWLRATFRAGEHSATLKAVIEILQSSDRRCAETWVIADLHFLAARIHWRQKRYLKSVMNAGQAFTTWPIMLGRPLKPLLQWLRPRSLTRELY